MKASCSARLRLLRGSSFQTALRKRARKVVGDEGFEPPTFAL